MITTKPATLSKDNLAAIADYANEHFYTDINFTCVMGLNYIAQVVEMDIHGAMALHTVLCEQIIDEIMNLLESKKRDFLAYFYKLSEKQQTQHDCSTCSGKCHMEHGMQIMSLKESKKKVESLIYRLQSEGTPLHNIDYPQLYGSLRKQMSKLEAKLRELFLFEETILIPAVISAQQRINVHL